MQTSMLGISVRWLRNAWICRPVWEPILPRVPLAGGRVPRLVLRLCLGLALGVVWSHPPHWSPNALGVDNLGLPWPCLLMGHCYPWWAQSRTDCLIFLPWWGCPHSCPSSFRGATPHPSSHCDLTYLQKDRLLPSSRPEVSMPSMYVHLASFSALMVAFWQDLYVSQSLWLRLFHAPTRTTSSGCFMLHRTVHALWNLYGNPYKNHTEKDEETVTWRGKS